KKAKFEALPNGVKAISKALNKASKKAHNKDLEIEKSKQVLTDEEMEKACELQSKAKAQGMVLLPERRVKNRARFVQIMQDNWSFIQGHQYLTSEQIVFLMSLVPHVAIGSNAIVDVPRKKQPVGLNQSEIAAVLGTSKAKVSRVVKSLVEKGVLAKAESGLEGNNVKSYVIFVNPHILISGSKDSVEDSLKIMFAKAMKMPVLKNLPERLF
ncbi:TPA: MarR family transcriptional regulator, partial [Bacillus paranthracis]